MAKSKNLWDVFYERIDMRSHKTVECVAAQGVEWKTAQHIKRINKKLCKITIRPTLRAGDLATPS